MTDETHEAPTDHNGPTTRLASWIADITVDQVPPAVRERAKHLILDGLACALVGAQLPWSRTAVEAVLAFEGAGDCPVIGWGTTTSMPAAALLNGTFIQGFELDDFHPLAPLHSTSLIVPALLSASRIDPAIDGRRFLGASIVGFEVGPRVGFALHGAEMLARGWHSGSVFGTISSAAAVANLLGLDGAAVEDALGLGATQSHGLMAAQFGAMSKRMHHGMASRSGFYAALLARGGYTGIKAVFEQPYGGFLSTFGEGHDPDVGHITSELGERWETERIAVKPYAAMGGLHAALDGLFEIRAERPFRPDDVAHIDVELSNAVYHHGWWLPQRPLTPTGAQMNIAYVLAVAVLDGAAFIEQFSPERIDSDDVWELIPRITAHHNPGFDAQATSRGQTKLTVSFTDDDVRESYQFAARSVLSPLSNHEVVAKYRHLTKGVIDAQRQSDLEQLILSLDTVAGLSELFHLLGPEVVSPFEVQPTRAG
jgi:2-methylcitrate dehydratase PrpD